MKKLVLLFAACSSLAASANVYLAGEINNWTSSEAYELTDGDGDGIYSLFLSLPEGTTLGRFKINDNEVLYGSQNSDDYKLRSTETYAAATADNAGTLALVDASANDRDLDIFYDTRDGRHDVIVVDKWYGLYVRGAFNGWGYPDASKLNYDGTGQYSVVLLADELKNMGYNNGDKVNGQDPGFKVASGDWQIEYGSNSDNADESMVAFDGDATALTGYSNTKNMYLADADNYEVAKLTFNVFSKEVKVFSNPLYLRGENFGNWNVVEDYRFVQSAVAPNVYELTFAEPCTITGGFKVADKDFTGYVNYGSAYGMEPVLKLTPYSTSADVNLGESTREVSKVYFATYLENGQRRGNLLLGLPEQLYVIGVNGDWNTNPINTVLAADANNLGVYVNENVAIGATDSEVRIFDNQTAGDYGIASWGLGLGSDSYTTELTFENGAASCTFIKGQQDKIKLYANKTYSISFNLFTGEARIVEQGSGAAVAAVESATANAIGKQGEIEIIGGTADVYTLGGALVATGVEQIDVPAGLYIVKTNNGKVEKVVVK